ncbi:hypothetical protein [Nitrosomonas communis]|uniref:hypothetical protein n=1 Tax=Nitrosomonas communis TaxID=44574 RepID=UPI0026F25429|nr:hypothetical protein [Nitrosomonas communis]MCO6428945.1 hypothetical protein [Nitrosomonas communis]
MFTLSARNQVGIGLALLLLMMITRSHHFASLHNLPDASWTVFFLAGVYLRSVWPLVVLLAFSGGLDFAAYTWGGVSGFCLTPAYVFLLPAYASLWLAGRWYARQHQFAWRTLMPLAVSMIAGLMLCELFSSGGFYFFSGRFEDTTWGQFAERLITFFPLYVESFLFYAGIALITHAALALLRQQFNSPDTSAG